ncbi:MAG TPA: 3-hydroxyacyl-ACP dehydratase FabZ [Steroidobacteraceae bacterium]|nr:3-hydroxyacyl-ACP dehydratase FabZ [Steroidobacteraceae bacterium]
MTETTTTTLTNIDIHEVMRRLPHRYPFLLVDRVLECQPGKSITALKNVTINEEFFQGHFPGNPVMPGVLMLEALAQAAGVLAFITENVYPDQITQFYFAGMDEVRFRKPVLPGDQLILKAKVERIMRGIWKYDTVAEVDGAEVTSAKMMIAVGKKK